MALSKKHRLSKRDFAEIKNKGGLWSKGQSLRVRAVKNDLPENRFGFVVGANVSKKATDRNKIKRRLRFAIQQMEDRIKRGFDVIIIASPQIKEKKYQEVEKDVETTLSNIKILIK